MLSREPTAIPFSAEAMRASLLRMEGEWEMVQASHDRDAVYGYLSVVFETVMAWTLEGRAVNRASRALHLRGHNSVREPEPFATVIYCTADPTRSMIGRGANGHGCCGTRHNTRTWMSRCGTSSSARAASTNVRRGLPVALGEVAKWRSR